MKIAVVYLTSKQFSYLTSYQFCEYSSAGENKQEMRYLSSIVHEHRKIT